MHCQAEIPQLKLILDKAVPNSRASYNSYQDVCKHMEYQLTMVCDCNYVAVRSILNSDSFSGLLILTLLHINFTILNNFYGQLQTNPSIKTIHGKDEKEKNRIEGTKKAIIPFHNNVEALTIQNCGYLSINPGAINETRDLKTLQISNISHLSIQNDGLSVSERDSLKIYILNSSCDDYLPRFSSQNSYQNVSLSNVRIRQNCTCSYDATNYFCQTYNNSKEQIEYQRYEEFDRHNCDHSGHDHSIFDEFTEEYLPDNKLELLGKKLFIVIVFELSLS